MENITPPEYFSEEQTICAFCNEPSTDLIQVTDTDGIRHPMCRGCLTHKDSDVECQCGSTDFEKQTDGFVFCKNCHVYLEENSFYYLSWSMKASQENYKQARLDHKKDKELCDIVFKLLRAEFDKVGTSIPFHPYHAGDLSRLIQAAKKLVIGKAIIDRDKIKEMENDIKD